MSRRTVTPLKLLPLGHGARPCLRCGYCCRSGPCGYGGVRSAKNQRCVHLRGRRPGEYQCTIIASIVSKPGWELCPAFGAGCCSSMNSDRQRLVEAERRRRA